MANPAPMLNVPVTGSPPQAVIDLKTFAGPLRVNIPNAAQLPPEGSVYATLGDQKDPELTGDRIAAGGYVAPPPPAEPDEGEFEQYTNLTVELTLAQLEKFAGRTVLLGYQGMGESGLACDSKTISLQIN